jgi:hypothetical protein
MSWFLATAYPFQKDAIHISYRNISRWYDSSHIWRRCCWVGLWVAHIGLRCGHLHSCQLKYSDSGSINVVACFFYFSKYNQCISASLPNMQPLYYIGGLLTAISTGAGYKHVALDAGRAGMIALLTNSHACLTCSIASLTTSWSGHTAGRVWTLRLVWNGYAGCAGYGVLGGGERSMS